MAVSDLYSKGFNAGYKVGYRSGLEGSAARVIMNRDLIWAYGCMALVLMDKHGWTGDKVESLILDIQARWSEVGDDEDPSDMAKYVFDRTGIQLEQKAEEIVNL